MTRPQLLFSPLFYRRRIIKDHGRVCRDIGALIPYYEAELKQNQDEIDRLESNMETIRDLAKEEIEKD
ncbi:hypothetical protein INT48_008089 [Thamnidium elegans]|uniref:Uncharacterized protein n=1 Tax=Thamnidium elegans TaxID=101142 RepID=A0A8H7VSG0_9FUNG|nr:hypothetical protein INT48_008089 [Thamnidium elegans]